MDITNKKKNMGMHMLWQLRGGVTAAGTTSGNGMYLPLSPLPNWIVILQPARTSFAFWDLCEIGFRGVSWGNRRGRISLGSRYRTCGAVRRYLPANFARGGRCWTARLGIQPLTVALPATSRWGSVRQLRRSSSRGRAISWGSKSSRQGRPRERQSCRNDIGGCCV
jgi:hypothetical protein